MISIEPATEVASRWPFCNCNRRNWKMFKYSLAIFGLIGGLLLSGTVVGQVDIPSPRFRYKEVEQEENTRPFAEPGVFNYDAQMFAPVQFTNGKELKPNTGFYFTYDRMYLSVSKPPRNSTVFLDTVNTGSHYIWGNRFEGGHFNDDDEGWGAVYRNTSGSFYTNGQDILVSQPMWVTTNFSDVGFNKMFRQALSRGGYLEPYVGLRYISVTDNTIEDTTQFLGQTAFNRFKQKTTNSAIGLQAGAKLVHRRGRFRVSGDTSIATTYNRQKYFATDIVQVGANTGVTEFYDNSDAFVPALDARLEIAYNISRDLALRTGFETTYMWDGIARANTLTTNLNPNSAFGAGGAAAGDPGIFDSNFVSAGFSFGIEWKR